MSGLDAILRVGLGRQLRVLSRKDTDFFFKFISVAVTLPDENIQSLSFPITGNHAECFLSGHRAVLINQVKVAFDQTVLI